MQLSANQKLEQAFTLCRSSELVSSDKNAKLTLRRAAEIQTICEKGLEQLPPRRKPVQLSRAQVLWCVVAD